MISLRLGIVFLGMHASIFAMQSNGLKDSRLRALLQKHSQSKSSVHTHCSICEEKGFLRFMDCYNNSCKSNQAICSGCAGKLEISNNYNDIIKKLTCMNCKHK